LDADGLTGLYSNTNTQWCKHGNTNADTDEETVADADNDKNTNAVADTAGLDGVTKQLATAAGVHTITARCGNA
jgi:hypothetical protein